VKTTLGKVGDNEEIECVGLAVGPLFGCRSAVWLSVRCLAVGPLFGSRSDVRM
jgi:hypothetical protein